MNKTYGAESNPGMAPDRKASLNKKNAKNDSMVSSNFIEEEHDCIYKPKYKKYKEETYKMSILIEQLQRKLKKYQEENKTLTSKLMKSQVQVETLQTKTSFCDDKQLTGSKLYLVTDPGQDSPEPAKLKDGTTNSKKKTSPTAALISRSKSKSKSKGKPTIGGKEPMSPYFDTNLMEKNES
jgi:hypothetical protein